VRTIKLKNVLYFPSINAVGGIETYCYEMGLKYGADYDITLLFRNGDPGMLAKIANTCRVIRYRDGDEVECDVFVCGWGTDILTHVKAKEVIQCYHADYTARHLNVCFDPRITKRFGVAENTTKGIVEHYGLEVSTMYNPFTPKKPRKVLKLVSATRLTPEKGFDRMVQLAKALEYADIPFMWHVFTDRPRPFPSQNVIVLPHRHDVLDFIADADYLVQLSDTEGYSYAIVEALSVGTPVICTEIPVAAEQGVITGHTGFILPFDMSEIPVDAIYKGLKKFSYTPRESHYETVLAKGKLPEEQENGSVTILAVQKYMDLQLNRIVSRGEELCVDKERAETLIAKGLAERAW
jgi:glycosyltransferase involved in cell wall biosynthesis